MNDTTPENADGLRGAVGEEPSPAELTEMTLAGLVFTKIDARFSTVVKKWVFEIYLGDGRKSTRSLWAKRLSGVDVRQKGGYAFQGEWLKKVDRDHAESTMSPGDMVVAVVGTGSWKHPGQTLRLYYADSLGVWRAEFKWWGSSQVADVETIHKIAEIYEKTRGFRNE